MGDRMRAWAAGENAGTIEQVELDRPVPAGDEVVVEIMVCGICRTDLHVVDHDIPVHRPGVVPGHQAIGRVVSAGAGVSTLVDGDLVGIAWLRRTCGVCEWCRAGAENLCARSEYTGWDADGGFAEYATVPEAYAYPLPSDVDPAELAPLLCAGIIGFRALNRAKLPAGGVLGIYGFGSSAHVTAQLAMAAGARVFAMTRGEQNGISPARSASPSSAPRPSNRRNRWTPRLSSPRPEGSYLSRWPRPKRAAPSRSPEST